MKQAIAEFPSEIGYIRKTSSEILNGLSRCKVTDDKLFEIKLCVEEAVRNAIVHGNKLDGKKLVKVSYWVDGDRFIIEIEDAGEGFDPRKVPDPTVNSNMLKESGRGMFIIRKLMDKVDFNSKGNKIRMEKKLWP
ncbi:MAG: ATP-binding protein [Candidatus Omnitrophota bacterium]